jgi:glycosyltransferase involved in cell wall biosynthesis
MSAPAKHILMIVENLPVPFDRRVWQEARALTEVGYRVFIISPVGRGYEKRLEILCGITIYRYPLPYEARTKPGFLLEYLTALLCQCWLTLKVFLRHGFDAIHACNPPDLVFLVALPYKLLFGRKFVFDQHDLCPEMFLAKFGQKKIVYWLLRVTEWLTFKIADRSIATNESFREIAMRRGGMAGDRVFVVRSGPDLNRLRVVAPDPQRRGSFAHMVGYLGVIGDHEGLNYLLQAVHHIVSERGRDDIKFLIIGSGPELPALQAMSTRLGIDHFVEFAGWLPDEQLICDISSCDLCVAPDEVNPMNDLSTMNKILEYMALEQPIVQFDLREGRVSAGEAAVYARPNDAIDLSAKILALIDAPEKRRRMAAIGRERIENTFAWHHQKPNLVACYASIFADGSV